MGKIDTDLDFRHEQWKGGGEILGKMSESKKNCKTTEKCREIFCADVVGWM